MPERTDSAPSFEGSTVERERGDVRVECSTGVDDQRCAGLEWTGCYCYGLGAVWGRVGVYLGIAGRR